MYLSYRVSALELKDGGVHRDLYDGTKTKCVFMGIAVIIGPSGGYNCYPTRREHRVLADIMYGESSL